MKTATTAMRAHLSGDTTQLARLYKITRADGSIFTFTDHDVDIDTVNYQSYLDDGGYVYEAALGFSPTAIQNKGDLTVDNQEATVFVDSETITENELRFGIWDAADVEIRVVNWSDLTQGAVKMRKGTLGNLSIKNGLLTAEVLGLTNRLQTLQGRSYGPTCDAELGDSRCQAVVPTESGTVASSSDTHTITPNAGLAGAVGYYDDGVVTFTSGNNAGLSFQIGTWDGGTLTLKNALFTAPLASDAFIISPGCAHNIADCRDKFNNLVNHRGFPAMPGQDAILQYPDSTG